MKTLPILTAIFGLVSLTACSTQPLSDNSYTHIQPLVKNNSDESTSAVVIRRDVGLMGSACKVDTYLDGIKYGSLSSGQSIKINTTEGEHILSAKFTGAICPDRLSEASLKLKENQTKYFRLAFDASGSFSIMPTLENPIK